LATGRLEVGAGEVALEVERQRGGRVDLAELARGRLLEALDDLVGPPARVAVGRLGVAALGGDVRRWRRP
jgi:hypothetical protein